MTDIAHRLAFVFSLLCLVVVAAHAAGPEARKTYRWVDEDGVVHFGDHLPPEHASTSRQILNEYGVPIANQNGVKTFEEIATEKAAREKADAERAQALASARHDQMLLDTYLTVEEIEDLRDRRLDLIETQIKVTENYLEGLRKILGKLQAEAATFKPYSANPDAPPIDERLAQELSTTMDSIMLYEQSLAATRVRKADVVGQFTADIDRFRMLKSGIPAK